MSTSDQPADHGTPTPPGAPDLPASLAARPVDPRRGLPIPPVNVHPDPTTGAPYVDFTTINTITATNLARARCCTLCGATTGYWVAFLGGPQAAEQLVYADPPACPPCARSAVLLCPYILIERHRRARPDRPGAGIIPPLSHGDKPDRWVLGITRDYRTVFMPEHGITVYAPAPFRTIETYTYADDGRINPTPTIRRRR